MSVPQENPAPPYVAVVTHQPSNAQFWGPGASYIGSLGFRRLVEADLVQLAPLSSGGFTIHSAVEGQLLYTLERKRRDAHGACSLFEDCLPQCPPNEDDRSFSLLMKDGAGGATAAFLEETTGCWSRGTPVCASDMGVEVSSPDGMPIGRVRQSSAMCATPATFSVSAQEGATCVRMLTIESRHSCIIR